MAGEVPPEVEALRKINDQVEERAVRMGVWGDRLEELHNDEFARIEDDLQQILARLEASTDDADKAALQLRAKDLQERWEQLMEESGHARNELEKLLAESETLRARAHEELEKLRSAGIETQRMLFETVKDLTTLNTAAILVYRAAGEAVSLPTWVALLFVLSLAGATTRMIATGMRWASPDPSKIGNYGMLIAVASFFVGLLYSALHAIVP